LKVQVIADDIASVQTDAILVNLFEGVESPGGATGAVDKALGGLISSLIEQGELKGKLNEVGIIHSMGKVPARIIAIAGLGKQADFKTDNIRTVTAQACRTLRGLNCRSIATILHGAGSGNIHIDDAAQAIVEGSMLGLYTFRKHKAKEKESADVEKLTIVIKDAADIKSIRKASKRAKAVGDAVIMARDMVNEPSNYMTPSDMAKKAQSLAENYSLDLEVLDSGQIKKLKMGALLGVAQGSKQPPKLMVLRYKGNPRSTNTIGLIGKGITFDSGGISIKPSEGMSEMKGDMSGGAVVMASIRAIAELKLKVNVIAVIPATENLPSGTAIKPGDVLIASNGKTIEVANTDAEGRLILADALCYSVNLGLSPIIDVATLTGACHIALGDFCSGIFSNDQEVANGIIQAGKDAGECMWQMPMNEEYKELNKSDIADIKNTGGRYGGAITAAQFLAEFVGDVPWVHIDIAGTFMSDKEKGHLTKGATGVAVRTLINFAQNNSK
jgi:leucyl aminopeptidase